MSAVSIDWDKLDPAQFEVFVYHLARAMGYDNVQYFAGPGDGGRDVVAYLPAAPGVRPLSRQVYFQCKRTKDLDYGEISNDLGKVMQFPPDTWILATTTRGTPQRRDWMERVRQSRVYPFYIEDLWREKLDQLLKDHINELVETLPEEIKRALVLSDVLRQRAFTTLEDVSDRFRAASAIRIQAHAAGKYRRDLLVHRAVQDRLQRLARPEDEVAAEVRTVCLHKIAELREGLRTHLETLDGWLADRSIGTRVKGLLGGTGPAADLHHLAQVRLKSATALQKLDALMDECRRAAEALPETGYHAHRDQYRAVDDVLVRLDGAVTTMPLVTPSGGATGQSTYYYASQPPITILTPRAWDAWAHARIAEARQSVRETLRHAWIVIDPAGSGKTTVFCRMAEAPAPRSPVLLYFGPQPVDGPNAVIQWVRQDVAAALGVPPERAVAELDRHLALHGTFLTVLIDGINESRALRDMGTAIEQFLAWSDHHRIKLLVSCRDIYAEFFDYIRTSAYLNDPLRDQLGHFSTDEYEEALPRYLQAFKIVCELGPAAREACQHPLLLRFFCEAHRSPDGTRVVIGHVADIRLKQLFGTYLERKAEAIRESLGMYDRSEVERFIGALASEMLKQETRSLTLPQIEAATGIRNTNTESSLYLRIRGEQIIIAEELGVDQMPRFSFIYEEFMEYMLARSLLQETAAGGFVDGRALFSLLRGKANAWANALGLGEYIALMLLEAEYGADRVQAMAFLGAMVRDGTRWRSVFWNVVGKSTEAMLGSDLFDLVQQAIHAGSSARAIETGLLLLSRCSPQACHRVAAVLLWSVAMPQVLRWTDLERLRGGEALAGFSWMEPSGPPSLVRPARLVNADLSYGWLLDRITPFLPDETRQQLDAVLALPHKPVRGIAGRESLLVVLERIFPEYRPLLINGLFSHNPSVRRECAFALRGCTFAHREVAEFLRVLAAARIDPEIGPVLLESAAHLERAAPRVSAPR